MLGWVVLIGSVVLMYRIAESEKRSGVVWGGITFVLCFLSSMFIPLPFINLFIGLVLSFGAMLLLNLFQK